MPIAYINANIPFTKHNAFIVEDGRFTYVGRKAVALKQPIDKVIDLADYTVLPGFHDSHMHVLGIGKSMAMLDLSTAASHDALAAQLRESYANPIVGRGFHESQFDEGKSPDKRLLNAVSTEVPIALYRVCGHMAIANDAAIKRAQAASSPPKDGVDIERGIFKEDAVHWLMEGVLKADEATIEAQILAAQAHLLAQGVTAVGSDDFAMYPLPFETILGVFERLATTGKLKLRVLEQANLPSIESLKRFIDKGHVNREIGRYRLGPLKLLADGSLGARSAYMREPYADQDTRGIRVFDPETLRTLITTANDAGMDIAIHAIGDACVDDILDVVESIPWERRRHRRHSIIHAQLAAPDQIERMVRLNVGAQTQPIFINSDIAVIHDAIGERAHQTYLFKSMADAGVRTTISTDAPVESANPFENLYVATTRRSLKHPERGPFIPEEAFDLKSAIDAYTRVPAYFSHQEKDLGQIKRGHLADFIIVDNFEDLPRAKVLSTYIEGERVHHTPKQD